MSARTAIYVSLSHMLSLLPASTGELGEALGYPPRTVSNWLRELAAAGLVARGEYRQREGRVYVRTDGPRFERAGWRYESAGLQRFIVAWHALRTRHSTDTLAAVLGTHRRTSSEILRSMHEFGLVKVSGWQVRHKTLMALYDRLPRPRDVPRPPRVPRQDSNATYWARRKAGVVGSGARA
jgi:DNA-binding transcriptional ArsR family regulator